MNTSKTIVLVVPVVVVVGVLALIATGGPMTDAPTTLEAPVAFETPAARERPIARDPLTSFGGMPIGACTPCHTCEHPVPDDPCLRPCLRSDGLGTDAAAGSEPDLVLLASLADLYEPVPFEHRRHAEMTEMSGGCVSCHHHTPEGSAPSACRTCHRASLTNGASDMPGLRGAYHRQCMSCHREWSHETACGSCHEPRRSGEPLAGRPEPSPGDRIGRPHPSITAQATYVYATHATMAPAPVVTFRHADHATAYGPRCVDCHRTESCSRCHDATANRSRDGHVMESCRSCHEEETSCSFCHDTRERPAFDHAARTGWTLEPYHAGVACGACHAQSDDAPPSTSCHGCHVGDRAGAFDHRLVSAGFASGSEAAECASCHQDVAASIDGATVVHGATAGPDGCLRCHDVTGAASPRVLRERRKDLCLGCHDRTIDTGRGRTLENIAALLANNPDHHGPIRTDDCTACHEPHASENENLLVEAYPPGFYAPFEIDRYSLCFRCHSEDRVMEPTGAGLTGFREGDLNLHWVHVNRSKGRTCRACHEVHASTLPFHIRETVPFGDAGWSFEINFEQTADGGSCAPACHGKRWYGGGS